ncbi:unnamed protein product, partial [Prorocentrum cordatum]
HDRTERDLHDVKTRMAMSEQSMREFCDTFSKLQRIVGNAEARQPCLKVDAIGSFDRAADPCTFWRGCASAFSVDELTASLECCFSAAEVTLDHIAFNTTGLGSGTPSRSLAARCWLNSEPVVFIHLYVMVATGVNLKLWREIQVKRLAKIIQDRFPTMDIHIYRSQGCLTSQNEALVQLHVGATADEPTRLQWTAAAVRLDIDDERQRCIRTGFESSFADAL